LLGLPQCLFTPMVISYTQTDTIRLFPSTYAFDAFTVPVYTQLGIPLATTWNNAVDGTGLYETLEDAGVLPPGTERFWSGGYTWVFGLGNCNQWTDGVTGDLNDAGYSTFSTTAWIRSTTPRRPCNVPLRKLCLCVSEYAIPQCLPTGTSGCDISPGCDCGTSGGSCV
jgi:hypothetical protein